MLNETIRRHDAVQKTVNYYRERPFKWGDADCGHLVAHCLKGLGYPDPFKDKRHYETQLQAARAMKKAGVASFYEYLDARFERIAPNQVLACDILAIDSGDPKMPTLCLSVGQDLIILFLPTGELASGPFTAAQTAWRVPMLDDGALV